MAAPANKNIKSLDGKWAIDKSISDDADPVLSLQGVGWLLRKTIGAAGITQHLKTSTDQEGVTVFNIDQFLSGGLKGTSESRTLDYQYRPHSDWLFGDVKGKSRWTTIANILEESKGKGEIEEDAKYLAEGWLPETVEGDVVDSYVENEGKGWTAWQIWGFAELEVKGVKERWFVRRFAVRKGKNVQRIRLCYSWNGELDA